MRLTDNAVSRQKNKQISSRDSWDINISMLFEPDFVADEIKQFIGELDN